MFLLSYSKWIYIYMNKQFKIKSKYSRKALSNYAFSLFWIG